MIICRPSRSLYSRPLDQQMEYLDGVIASIQSHNISVQLTDGQDLRWITPYEDISGQLGNKGRYALRLLIGMLLDAPGESQNLTVLQDPDEGGVENLNPSIMRFIENLDIDDLGSQDRDTS